jgi:hypothetical protein
MNPKSHFIYAAVFAALLTTISNNHALSGQLDINVASSTQAGSKKNDIMTNDDLFRHVPLDTNEQTFCSPADPGFTWRGVVLRAPSQVTLPGKSSPYSALIIPICGLYLINSGSTSRHPGPKILIITDITSGKIYSGALVKPDPYPTIPPPRTRPVKPNSNAAFGEYFNVNAADYVTLPMQPARYRVKIEYAGHQSNELLIAVVERPER